MSERSERRPADRATAREPDGDGVWGRRPPGRGSMTTPVIKGTGLVKVHQAVQPIEAVRGASLEIATGEIVVVSGPSGSGKTTLLGLLAGFEPADDGAIAWHDGDIGGAWSRWSSIAFVPQALGLLDELSIEENIAVPIVVGGLPPVEHERVGALIDQLGLGGVRHRFPSEVSLGEQQRAAVARALVAAPQLVVLDEPTAHQDRHSGERILAALRSAAATGTAFLVASHDPDVEAIADRRLTIVDGVLDATPL